MAALAPLPRRALHARRGRMPCCAVTTFERLAHAQATGTAGRHQPSATDARAMLDTYCVTCHNQRLKTAGLALDTVDVAAPHANPELWERVIARLRAGTMPPSGRPRPAMRRRRMRSPAGWNRRSIAPGSRNPNPGRGNAVHRLNRTQYSNAVRDLFALDPTAFDVKSLLPGDETADGSFDNFADVLTISTAHLERYLSAARQVTRLATGLPPSRPALETFEIPLHVVQDDRQDEDLPFGSRGGIAVRLRLPGRWRVPDQGSPAPAVSGLPDGHGLAAAARRPPRRQAAEALRGGRQGAGHVRPRPVTRATASRASRALPSGKPTCSSPATPASRSACR